MRKIQIQSKSSQKMRQGYPLIQLTDLVHAADQAVTEQFVEFVDRHDKSLGFGYLGKQNKGVGWLISRSRQSLNTEFFTELFAKAIQSRSALFLDEQTNAFRLFNGEGDGLGGVTIDLYNEFALFTWYNSSIYAFRERLISAFLQVAPFVRGCYEKNRFTAKGVPESQHVQGDFAPTPLLIQENGLSYATYLDEGMMTGIFLDQREVRQFIRQKLAQGKRLLNTFSYTGAFSVAAAAGGAAETVSVDLAKRSLPKTTEMFATNQLPLATNQIRVMDVFAYLKYATKKSLSFDIIVLDPPSFARNKSQTFSVAKNYGELVAQSLPILAPAGFLVASTNAANVTLAKYQGMVETALHSSGRPFQLTKTFRLPGDFNVSKAYPEGNYLKVLVYQVD